MIYGLLKDGLKAIIDPHEFNTFKWNNSNHFFFVFGNQPLNFWKLLIKKSNSNKNIIYLDFVFLLTLQ